MFAIFVSADSSFDSFFQVDDDSDDSDENEEEDEEGSATKQSSSNNSDDIADAKSVISKAKVEDDEYKTDEQTYYR